MVKYVRQLLKIDFVKNVTAPEYLSAVESIFMYSKATFVELEAK